MGSGRLAIDQTPRFDRRFLGIALALDAQPALITPARRLAARIVEKYLRKRPLQPGVSLQLQLDLLPEFQRNGASVAKNTYRYLRVADDLLNHSSERDHRRFVMLACPQVQAIIRLGLYLPATSINPRVQRIDPAKHPDQQVITIVAAQPAYRLDTVRRLQRIPVAD